MKRFFSILFVLLLLTSCAPSPNQNHIPDVASSDFEEVDCEHFTVKRLGDFKAENIDGGVKLYKGSDILEIWVRGENLPENFIEEDCVSFALKYAGTTPEKTEVAKVTFYKTNITAFDLAQTIYIGEKDGRKIQIGVVGEKHEENAELLEMLNSIKFK